MLGVGIGDGIVNRLGCALVIVKKIRRLDGEFLFIESAISIFLCAFQPILPMLLRYSWSTFLGGLLGFAARAVAAGFFAVGFVPPAASDASMAVE